VQARRGFSSQRSRFNRARGTFIGKRDESAARQLFSRYFRHDRHAQTGADRTQDAAEVADLKHDLRIQMGALDCRE
jgi:hypothetical protein